MISYKEYVRFRDRKGYKDSDVARLAEIPQATLSEWKRGRYTPKYEKMRRIEQALGLIPVSAEENYIVIEEPAPAALRDDEMDILKVYNGLNAAGKKELLKLAKMVASQDEYMLKGDGSQSSDAV